MYRSTSTHAQDTNRHTHPPLLHTRVFTPRQSNNRSPPTHPHSSPLSEPVFISTWTFHCVCALSGFFKPFRAAAFVCNSDSNSPGCTKSRAPCDALLLLPCFSLPIMFSFVSQSCHLLLKKQAERICMDGKTKTDTCDLLFFSQSFLLLPTSRHSKGQRPAALKPPSYTVHSEQRCPGQHTLLTDTSCSSRQRKAASGGRAAGPAPLLTRYHCCLTTLLLTWSLRAETPSWCCDTMQAVLCQASLPPPCHLRSTKCRCG